MKIRSKPADYPPRYAARCVVPLCALLTGLYGTSLFADDWPQWRGPTRDGIAPDVLPQQLPDQPNRAWQVEVGTGHSSPVVVDGTIYQLARQGEQEVLLALNLEDGSEVWRWAVETPYQPDQAAMGHGKGPKSTPVVDGGTICTLGIAGRLACLNRSSGELLWANEYRGDFDRTSPDFGASMSPAIIDGLLIAHVGGNSSGAIVAVEPASGKERWRWSGDAPGYASPVLVTLGESRQIVTQTRDHVVALDPTSGAELWRTPFSTAYAQNVVTPAIHGEGIILSGVGTSVFSIQPTPAGRTSWMLTKAWENADVPMYMSSPVVGAELVFGMTDRRKGQLFAMNPENGEVLWSSEGREGENGALVLAGSRLLMLTTEGELQIGPASADGWQPEVRWEVATSPTWAHPAIADGHILVKDKTHLIAYSLD